MQQLNSLMNYTGVTNIIDWFYLISVNIYVDQ